jgi:predicted enzyme related to lactoylglutathione lyase
MLSDHQVMAALPAQDYDRAVRFYKEKLDLTPSEEGPDGATFRCAGGTSLLVFPSMGEASGTHTQAGFEVSDLSAEVSDLKANGVTFLEYDTPELKTVDGIAELGEEKGAWFKDSEGNIIALFQRKA